MKEKQKEKGKAPGGAFFMLYGKNRNDRMEERIELHAN